MLSRFSDNLKQAINYKQPPASPHKYLSSKEYVEKFNGDWRKAYDACDNRIAPPTAYGSRQADFGSTLSAHFPELGVMRIEHGQLLGPHGWVLGEQDYWLPEHAWHGMDVRNAKMPRTMAEPVDIPGVVLSLASDWSSSNYGHLLLDSVSRLHLVRQTGYVMEEIDTVYFPFGNIRVVEALADQLGIDSHKCLFKPFAPDYRLRAGVLLAPSFPGIKRNYPAWVVEFLKETLHSAVSNQKRRLYVTREGGTRKVANEQAIIELLVKHDFEIYNPLHHRNPRRDFAEASMIVGAHGAGLTDIVFCQPGTQVLELMPSDHVYPYFYSIAEAAKLKYGYILCPSQGSRKPGSFGPSPFDFTVPVDDLKLALDKMLAVDADSGG